MCVCVCVCVCVCACVCVCVCRMEGVDRFGQSLALLLARALQLVALELPPVRPCHTVLY